MIRAALEELGGMALFYRRVVLTSARTRGLRSAFYQQMSDVIFRSLPTVIMAGLFVGAILSLQFDRMLAEYDARTFLGGLATSSIVREVGPLIISFLLAGKIGAFTAAELANMRVTDQIDAVECLGVDSVEYLIVPRFLAIVAASILLLTLGLMVSILGALLVGITLGGVNPIQFLSSVPKFTSGWTLFSGFFKSTVYALIVGGVACYKGYTAKGGARGVGIAVTQAAIFTNFYIVIANNLTSHFLDFLHGIGQIFSR